MSPIPHLAFTRSEFAGVGDFDDIPIGFESLEKGNGFFGFLERLDGAGDDKGNFLDLLDPMSAGEDERRKGRSSKGRYDSEAALVLVHFDVPFTPSLGWCEHASPTAHVTKGTLTRSMRSSTSNTRDTSNSTTSTPRLGTSLVSSFFTDSIGLSLVLGDTLVHLLDYVEPNRCGQNRRKRE
jgi:hypothetical protein